jgi:hypothetical protein
MKTNFDYTKLRKSEIYEKYDDYIINLERTINQLEEEREEINKELRASRLAFKRFWEHVKREEEKLKTLDI